MDLLGGMNMKTVSIVLTQDQLAAFVYLVDLGVKKGGLQAVQPAALVVVMLEQAQRELKE